MYAGLNEGMHVYSSDGHRVGKVIRCLDDGFEIEKGFFFPKEYFATYDEILRLEGDRAILRFGKDALSSVGERTERPGFLSSEGAAAAGKGTGIGIAGQKEEVRVPVAEERLEAEKRLRETGEVRVTKQVVTEQKTLNVPVTREEVHVERVPVSGTRPLREGEATFQEGTVSVPIREEEVEIRKRPVIKEEVRVSKTPIREEKRVSENVRREEVDVDEEGTRPSWSDTGAGTGLHAGPRSTTDYPAGTRGIDEDLDKP